ncbi:cupin [Burkholderia singularis]|uniref:Cupin n=1 Tax=Burkholderia singularis TaxID=1503053 RepID=A0A124P9M6_9BURK|nr:MULTISPECIES: cupin domain-containing protein [Burkholderia]AOK32551.1 cupin [Burkholderia sp. Bp7605]KVE28942.1 cupin [Burkholderia singularis]
MPKFDLYRKIRWHALVHEYGLDGQRLLPWDGYSMPFGGGWCVVRPHTVSEPHTQIDQELFIAIKGKGSVVIGETTYPFEIGDIVVIPKHTNHYVINDSDEDFHFYVIWWDEAHVKRYMNELNDETGCLND